MPLAVVDTGPLYAAVNAADPDHQRCLETLERNDLKLVVPAMVITEVSHFLGQRHGPDIEAGFLAGLADLNVEAPTPDEWPRIADLVKRYGDLPLGGVDASVAVLAERLNTPWLISLDHRHFPVLRPKHCDAFRLLPD